MGFVLGTSFLPSTHPPLGIKFVFYGPCYFNYKVEIDSIKVNSWDQHFSIGLVIETSLSTYDLYILVTSI